MTKKPMKKNARSKFFRKRKVPYQSTKTLIANTLAGFPERALVKMKYFDVVTVSYTGGVTTDTQFRLNSIYDPLASGAGVYPSAYTAYTTFYSLYRVNSVRYRIQFPNIAGEDILIGVIPYNGNTTYNSVAANVWVAEPRAKWHYNTGSSNPEKDTKFTGYIKLHQLTGQTMAEYKADDSNFAAIGANPTKLVNMHCVGNPIGNSSNLPLCVFLEFDVEFFGPKQQVA